MIECPTCGIIFKSRENWVYNPELTDSDVRTETVHVWPLVRICLQAYARFSLIQSLFSSIYPLLCLLFIVLFVRYSSRYKRT